MKIRSLGSLLVPYGDDGVKIPTPFLVIFALIILTVLWSTWLVPDNNQSVVIQQFGKNVRTVGPGGLHFKAPWPIETATIVGTTALHQMEVGFRTEGDPAEKKYVENQQEAEMFTSDMNLVQIDFTTQYQLADASAWLFNVNEPETVLRALAESSIRNVVGGQKFDDVVTTGRGIVASDAAGSIQDLASKIGMGIRMGQVNLQDAHPPLEVMAAFRDVNNAREEREQLVQQGQGYYNANIPVARATANQKIEKAIGYKNRRIAEATGEANRFLSVLEKYHLAPEITAQRMRFEALNAVLPGSDQVVDLGGKDSSLFKFFDVNRQQLKTKE